MKPTERRFSLPIKPAILCLALPMAASAQVHLNSPDALGFSSFNTAGNWSDGQAPQAGKTYSVAVQYLRTPTGTGSHVFAGDSLTVTSGGGLIYKGAGTNTYTIDPLILDNGGSIRSGASSGDRMILDGSIVVSGATASEIRADQSPYTIASDLSGAGDLLLSGGHAITFTGASTMEGDLNVSGNLTQNATGSVEFTIQSSGISNAVTGSGTVTYNGAFAFDLSSAGAIVGDTWTVASVANQTFGSTFAVTGFTRIGGGTGPGIWRASANGANYRFETATGVLRVTENLEIAGTLLVDLTANDASAGSAIWTNNGTLGDFASIGSPTHAANVLGTDIPGVGFAGSDFYQGPNSVADIEGSSDRSIEVWVFNEALAAEETLVSWGHRGTTRRNMSLNHGSDASWGAATHFNDDIGWFAPFPSAGSWYHLVYTYDGGTAVKVYVNGNESNSTTLGDALDTFAGEPINLACQRDSANGTRSLPLTGLLNTVRIHSGLLTPAQVQSNFQYGPAGGTLNASPTLAPVADQNLAFGATSRMVTLTVSDPDTPVANLVVSGMADDAVLLPPGSFTFTGTGATRWVTITPAAGQSGTTNVSLTVSDGVNSSVRSFTLNVAGAPADPGADEDGDTLTNGEEANLGTNPYLADTDGDGTSDSAEVTAGSDPLDALSKPGFDPTQQRVEVEEAMRRANDYFQANHAIGNEGWERGAYQTGNFRAWQTLGYQPYYDRAVAWGVQNNWDHGTDYGDVNGESADAHCCGQIYADLYLVDPQPERIATITSLLESLLLDDPSSVDDWWWVDAIYMAAPTLARLAAVHSDDRYLDQMMAMYLDTKERQGLFNPALGLWWRDGAFLNTNVYWGRGNGWAIGACARVLEVLPANDPRRPEFEAMLRTMATALLPWQQPDGMWRSSVTDPTNPSYANPETSGTAFFTYGIAYGLNHGILVDGPGTNYTAAVMNAWQGMTTIAQHPSGALGYIQSVGSQPGPAAYTDTNRDYGYGAFLLAGSEILDLLGGVLPVFPDAGSGAKLTDADGNYAESHTLNATASQVRSGSVTEYRWWHGRTYLGAGSSLQLDFPLGNTDIRLDLVHSDGHTYSNQLTVSVLPPAVTATASGSQSPNVPANTLDGNFITRWSREGNTGTQFILYELPQTETLDHIDIAFFDGNTRQSRIAIWLSLDGVSFTRVLPAAEAPQNYVSSSGTTLGLQTFSFPVQDARYVRINGWGNSVSAWNSITEVEFPIQPPTDQGDHDGNGLPDSWEIHHFGTAGLDNSTTIGVPPVTLAEAYILGIDPGTPGPAAQLRIGSNEGSLGLSLESHGAFGVGYHGLTRYYRILTSPSLSAGSWTPLPGYDDLTGDNGTLEIPVEGNDPQRFYKTATWLE